MIIFIGAAGLKTAFRTRFLPAGVPHGRGDHHLICAVLTVIMALPAPQRPTMSPIMTTIQGRWDHRLSDRGIRY
jgi:hypothetical protein